MPGEAGGGRLTVPLHLYHRPETQMDEEEEEVEVAWELCELKNT